MKYLNDLATLVSLCKRRGFVFQSSEIYGGLNSCWDYGPLGSELKRNIRNEWWRSMVSLRDDVFTDPLVECKKCHHRFRSDHLKEDRCPDCGGELMEARPFNMMLKTFLGV